uniref:Mitotic spindle assembly checkpoint protein MAD2A-like n=1 Tax=Dermatophagoides pteronyssinus TaxID=6956 RepID=A0A6P6Y6S4_DERPT|nr:mitotic spindle assembly checkpoint protein MAD2A-like [Dermatophagoides pteronyssinus]
MSSVGVCNSINLKGSVSIIKEFFNYCINNILFQRGIYPSDSFKAVQNYGLTILMTKDDRLKKHLQIIFDQMQEFLLQRKLHRVVMTLIRIDTKETIERWEFKIDCNNSVTDDKQIEVDLKAIQTQIRDLIRQITASITYLPLIDDPVSFDILFYTDKDIQLSSTDWSDSSSHIIPNAEEVQLRSFTTKVHNLKASVAFKQNG